MPVQIALMATLPAAILAAALLLGAWRPWKPTAARGWWGSALALGLGYALADRLVWTSWTGMPPREEHRWLPLIGLAGAAFGLAEPAWRNRPWRGYAVVGLAGLCMLPLLWDFLASPSSRGSAVLFLALWTAACVIVAGDTDTTARQGPGARVPLALWATAAGAALVHIQSASLLLGMTVASIAAVMGVFVLLAWWRPGLNAVAAAVPAYVVLLLGSLVANRQTYVEARVLLILAALTPGLGRWGPFRRLPGWGATLACLAISVALAAAAIGWFTLGGFHFGEGE
jgi:hypothetical protein